MARWRKTLLGVLWFLLTSTSTSIAAASEQFICADPQLSVNSDSPGLASLACQFTIHTKERIMACGFIQSRAIEIVIVDSIEHHLGECLATYDCAADIFQIADPVSIAATLKDDNPYSSLPEEVVFQALISHEMAHALLEQSSVGTDLAFVDHEYVAAAMELDILEPEWRKRLISAAPVSLPPKVGLISALIYGFEPRKFATNSWQYFDAEADGCERIRRIADGEFSFSDQPR
jgi:hypothetical protein